MLDKNTMGYISLVFVVVSTVIYIHSILRGNTRPHIFTNVIWSIVSAIASAAQYSGNAGAGSWAGWSSAAFCIIIAALCFSHGEKTITRSDWLTFIAALCIIPIWYATANPLIATILATLIDVLGYYPTFRKSWHKPHQEMITPSILSNIKHIFSIFAMSTYSLTTLLYPAVLFLMNSALIVLLAWRRPMYPAGNPK